MRSRSYSQCRPGNSVADREVEFWLRGRTDREWEGGYDVGVWEGLGEIADVRCGASVCIVEMGFTHIQVVLVVKVIALFANIAWLMNKWFW